MVSFPRPGKHLVFDGRYLHAALHDLSSARCLEDESKAAAAAAAAASEPPPPVKGAPASSLSCSEVRTTFLANIWLGHHPRGIQRMPADLSARLSGGGGRGISGSDTPSLLLRSTRLSNLSSSTSFKHRSTDDPSAPSRGHSAPSVLHLHPAPQDTRTSREVLLNHHRRPTHSGRRWLWSPLPLPPADTLVLLLALASIGVAAGCCHVAPAPQGHPTTSAAAG